MLHQWLRERCVPVVATLVTEDADQTCRKNNMNFEQLVSAFARLDGLKVPFRSANQQYSLDSFALRFVRGTDMRPSSASEADPALEEVVFSAADGVAVTATSSSTASAVAGGDRDGRRRNGAEALLESGLEHQGWYKRYRTRLWESLCHQEHEMLDCPAAVLVVVSSTEATGDPVACFDELSSPIYLPPPFQSRQYDPQSPALVYVLLHDWCRGAALGVDPHRVLSQMRASFTAGQCRLLCINSLPPESPNLSQQDMWAEVVRESKPDAGGGRGDDAGPAGRVRGAFLSPEDLLSVKEFVRGLVSQVVVPSMERRIQTLNQNVTSVRKGVKNVLKSWWRKPRESLDTMSGDGGGSGGGATYRYDRIESQIRLLADSAFLMRDYETAVSMYRMARDDFKSDRALLHYAAASEMLAISLFLLQGRASSSPLTGLAGGVGVSYSQINSIMGAASSVGAAAASVTQDLSFNSLSSPKSGIGSGMMGSGGLGVGGVPGIHGGGVGSLHSVTLLGRGREAGAAFAAALDAYERRAVDDSVAAASAAAAAAAATASKLGGYPGMAGGGLGAQGVAYGATGGVGGLVPPAARLAARAALLFADVAAAASDDPFSGRAGARAVGDARSGAEALQAEAEEALQHASLRESPLSAAILLEVSAHRCRSAGRLRRASFRLVQAGDMYKEFSASRATEWRRAEQERVQQQQQGIAVRGTPSVPLPPQHALGMHAARCYLGALAGYQGSGWLAAEEYTCTVLPAELQALQRPVAALQLYVRSLSARGQGLRSGGDVTSGGARGSGGQWAQHSQQQQQLKQQQLPQEEHQGNKRALMEKVLMLAFRDLCRAYPQAARIAARAWSRGRGSSRLDMTFFPVARTGKRDATTPPATPTPSSSGATSADDLPDQGFDGQTGGDVARSGGAREAEGHRDPRGDEGDRGVVFEGLPLPAVVHEQTRAVDTENASVAASVQVADNSAWVSDMADALRAELAAAEAVREGKGPWLTVSAAYGHQAGALPRDPSTTYGLRRPLHLPPPPRSAPVGEPVTILVVLENRFSIPMTVENLQLVLTSASESENGGGEGFVSSVAVDEKDFEATCASPESYGGDGINPSPGSAPGVSSKPTSASVVVERKRATVGPGKRLPVLLKFCALRASDEVLTVSFVRWTVLEASTPSPGAQERREEGGTHVPASGGTENDGPRVWISHRLEGKGQLLHGTREQRATRARAPAPPPRFEAMGLMPWLGCSLEGVPPTTLQGEAVRATLKICNRGRAPAGELVLKTNLPWVAFESPKLESLGGEEEGTGAATGGAVGASGTTLLPPVGVILPGESIELPVWVRGRGGGRQSVKMLVRYKRARSSEDRAEGGDGVQRLSAGDVDPVTDASEPASPLFRMERHAPIAVEMCVLPSLSVAASVLPSYSRRGEYVLSLEATNYRTSGDESGGNRHLRIHKVCAISRCWHMEPLAGFPSAAGGGGGGGGGDGKGEREAGGTIVRWQERITLHYRLFPATACGDAGSGSGEESQPVRHNDCTLGLPGVGFREGSADSPHLPLLCLEQAASSYYIACRKHRQQELMEAAAAAADEHPRTIQGVRKERERERAALALKKEEEEEERRWRTQRHVHPTSPEALCSPELSLVHLMVLWGLDESKDVPPRRGQHHVRSLVIRPEKVDRQCPLVLTVKYPSEVCWKGRASSLDADANGEPESEGCVADVTVCATNRLAGPGEVAKVNFTFEVRPDDGPRRLSSVPGSQSQGSGGGAPPARRAPRNRFVWLGATRRRIVGLGPGEATTIPLKVRFFRPGVFDLNRFRFVVEFSPPRGSATPSSSSAAKGGYSTQPSTPGGSQQSGSSAGGSGAAGGTSQQRSAPSGQQQGRVTFVFPAQYLVTVAPASQLKTRPVDDEEGGAANAERGVVPEVECKARVGPVGPSSSMVEEVAVA